MSVATVSSRGQVVIPREIRERMGLEEGTKVEVEVAEGKIILRPLPAEAQGWQRWEAAFAGEGLLKALAEEHAAEIAREERS